MIGRPSLGVAVVASLLWACAACGSVTGSGSGSGSSSGRSTGAGSDPGADFRLEVKDGIQAGVPLKAADLLSSGDQPADIDLITRDQGELSVADGPDGENAIRYPAYSASSDGPIAIVTVTPLGGDWMDPGEHGVRFGLDVNVDAKSSGSPRDNGDNLLQRGLFPDGAQYKIQIDHHYASCVVTGDRGTVMAALPQLLAPDDWYHIVCTRDGNDVDVSVSRYAGDKLVDEHTGHATGQIGSIEFAPSVPLTIGGKIGEDEQTPANATDQFNGSLAGAFLDVGK